MTVSRAAAELDEKLTTFRQRSLKEMAYPYVQIDARYEHVRIGGKVVSQAVLVVFGFNAQGVREILDWRVADSESEVTGGSRLASSNGSFPWQGVFPRRRGIFPRWRGTIPRRQGTIPS